VVHLYPGHWTGLYGDPEGYKNQVRHCITRYPVFATEWGFRDALTGNLKGTIANYGQPLMDFYEGYKISNSAWVTDYSWQPQMYDSSWNLLVGPGEMGGFVKDTLYAKRLFDQPGGGDTIPPAAPTGLDAYAGDGIVMLWWNNNTEGDLAGYDIYRSTTSGGGYSKINLDRTLNVFYDDVNISGGVTYYYVVTAVDTSFNSSDFSNEVSATPTDTTPPSAPTGLSASANDSMVSLNWNNNPEGDINGYNVYRSLTSGSGYVKINPSLLSNSDYIDNSVSNGTTYYYVVTAVDTSSNQSGYSSQVSATPHIITDVNILGSWVSGLSHAKENGTGRALVFLVHAEYNISGVSLNSVTYGTRTMTKIIDRYLAGSSNGVYAAAYILNDANIVAANSSGTFSPSWTGTPLAVAYSSVFLVNVDQTVPVGTSASGSGTSNPTTTAALSTNNGDMVIEGAACSNTGTFTLNNSFSLVTEYTMTGSDGVDGYKHATGVSETPSVTHSNGTARKVIIGFVVKAAVQQDLPPAAPTGLTATGGVGKITLNWNNNAEPDLNGYNVYRSTTSGSGYSKLNASLLSNSNYTDTNVFIGTPYYYVVTAVDVNNNQSGYSNQASATANVAAIGAGAVLSEWWTGIPGDDVNSLTSDVNYPDNSTGRELLVALEGPVNWADNYGTRIRGYLNPIANGNYTFWIASDANSELWLSTDSNSANAVLIAYVSGFTGSREWNKYASQQSALIPLVSSQKYYIEALHKAGTGNDNIAVAWQGPGITQQVIDGLFLSPCCLEFEDFAGFASQWNQTGCNAGNDWCNGFDFNRSGSVTINDLNAFVENWLTGM